jgi:hypothetical protein
MDKVVTLATKVYGNAYEENKTINLEIHIHIQRFGNKGKVTNEI